MKLDRCAVLVCVSLAACGGGGGGGTTPTPNSVPTATPATLPSPVTGTTITITAQGAVEPSNLVVSPGTRVTFVNQDSLSHDMSSDPHPEHSQSPEINQIGFLTAGQSRTSGNFNTARTCGFHDHNLPADTGLQGRVIIQ